MALEDFLKSKPINVPATCYTNLQKDDDIGEVVDVCCTCVKDVSVKICEAGLNSLLYCVMQKDVLLRPLLGIILPLLVERFGDAKQSVRSKAVDVAIAIARSHSPKELFQFMISQNAFAHKNWKVKEAVCNIIIFKYPLQVSLLFCKLLSEFGPASMSFKTVLPEFIKLLSDANAAVRDSAYVAMDDMYRYKLSNCHHDLL